MGRWILHPSYITASAKKGEWLTEEDYEWVNFLKDGEQEMGLAARRWRFNVEAFMSFPFSGWKVAVIVRGARKSSIYTRQDIVKLVMSIRKTLHNWFEYILLHDRFAKGLGTSSENLECLLLYNIIYIQLSEQNGKVTRLIFQIYILHVILLYYILKYSIKV